MKTCVCGDYKNFTNKGTATNPDWVHVTCLLPTKEYVKALQHRNPTT
jgi:hypothetical protein